jgi:predicted RecA/RadA family phage recombinase
MAQLTAAKARIYEQGDQADYGVRASQAIYEGSVVGLVPSSTGAGYARQLEAGDIFVGFAMLDVAAPAADGGALVRVRQRGKIVVPLTSVAVTDIGKPVYASDGDTFTLTAGSNTHVGRVARVDGTNSAVVEFDASNGSLGAVTELTDSSGGTAADTIAAIGGSYNQAEVRNAVASLAAKINAILRQLG